MVVLRLMRVVITPPAVSMPRDSGATSSKSKSDTDSCCSPVRMAAWGQFNKISFGQNLRMKTNLVKFTILMTLKIIIGTLKS
jgi:hypothetical protein